jgi:hypothetical protein
VQPVTLFTAIFHPLSTVFTPIAIFLRVKDKKSIRIGYTTLATEQKVAFQLPIKHLGIIKKE